MSVAAFPVSHSRQIPGEHRQWFDSKQGSILGPLMNQGSRDSMPERMHMRSTRCLLPQTGVDPLASRQLPATSSAAGSPCSGVGHRSTPLSGLTESDATPGSSIYADARDKSPDSAASKENEPQEEEGQSVVGKSCQAHGAAAHRTYPRKVAPGARAVQAAADSRYFAELRQHFSEVSAPSPLSFIVYPAASGTLKAGV